MELQNENVFLGIAQGWKADRGSVEKEEMG